MAVVSADLFGDRVLIYGSRDHTSGIHSSAVGNAGGLLRILRNRRQFPCRTGFASMSGGVSRDLDAVCHAGKPG